MKRILSIILALFIMVPTFNLMGCATTTDEQITDVIRICNCEDYINEDLLDEFTEETGIEVIYSTYGTNENLYNELVINPNSYDLVVPSEYMIEKLATEGKINKLDKTKIKGYSENLSPFISDKLESIEFEVKDGEFEGETANLSEFMVGYMWGTMGWVYNTANVSEDDVRHWDSVFNNDKLNKKITIKDSVRDSYIIGLAMVYQNELIATADNDKITEILNRTDDESIRKVGEKLSSIKNKLYGFEVDSGKNYIVLGNIDAYVAWSGDAAYASDVAAGRIENDDGKFVEEKFRKNLGYYIPDEGSNIWFDGFVMPSGSQNYDVVYKFLEFICSPENVYKNMDVGYTSMIAGNGDFKIDEYDDDGNFIETRTTNLFTELVVNRFDETETIKEGEGIEVDLSYFFNGTPEENTVIVSKENYGRLIAQYPELDQVSRCAVMSYFNGEQLMATNEMWEKVKGVTFSNAIIIATIVLVALIALLIIIYRNKDKLTFIKLPERKTTYAERKGLKLIKREEIK